MPADRNRIAVVFDFDDTLTDDSTTLFLRSRGIDADDFWTRRVPARIEAGWDLELAWLRTLLDEVRPGGALEGLTNRDLADFGAQLQPYPGVLELFDDLRAMCAAAPTKPDIRFYIVTGGLEEIVAASSIAAATDGVRGCRLAEGPDGVVSAVQNVVGFTVKTRVLYEINKGVFDRARKEPFLVNKAVAERDRPVPFEHMVYVGDGMTDIPSFSLVQSQGGQAIGVYDPRNTRSVRRAWFELAKTGRVSMVLPPQYGRDDGLGSLLRTLVDLICKRLAAASSMSDA